MKTIKFFALPLLFCIALLTTNDVQAQGGTEVTIFGGGPSAWFTGKLIHHDCVTTTPTLNTGFGPQTPGTGVYYPGPTTNDVTYGIYVCNSFGDCVIVGAPFPLSPWPQIATLPSGETVEWNGYYGCSHPSVVLIYP